jgi:hypothetical protein
LTDIGLRLTEFAVCCHISQRSCGTVDFPVPVPACANTVDSGNDKVVAVAGSVKKPA